MKKIACYVVLFVFALSGAPVFAGDAGTPPLRLSPVKIPKCSAGGHLSLLYAYDGGNPSALGLGLKHAGNKLAACASGGRPSSQ